MLLKSNKKFYFTVSVNDDDFSIISIPSGTHELESLDDEFELIQDRSFTEENNLFTIKPNFSTLGLIIEIKPNLICTQTAFTPDNSTRDLLGLDSVVL